MQLPPVKSGFHFKITFHCTKGSVTLQGSLYLLCYQLHIQKYTFKIMHIFLLSLLKSYPPH